VLRRWSFFRQLSLMSILVMALSLVVSHPYMSIIFFNLLAQPSKGLMIYTGIPCAVAISDQLDQGNVHGIGLHLY